MTVYYILMGVIIIFGLIQYFYYSENKIVKFTYIAVCGIIFFLIAGFRYGLGFDYYTYLDIFEDIGHLDFTFEALNGYRFEIGFTILVKLLTMISTNGTFIYAALSFLMTLCVMYVVYRYSKIPMISLFLYMVLNYYFVTMNMTRYAFASSLIFLSYGILKDSNFNFSKESFSKQVFWKNILTNFLPYTLLILLAASFHKTALIMLPVYFVAKLDLNKITGSLYAIATTIVLFAAKPIAYFVSEKFFNGSYNPYVITGTLNDRFYEPAGGSYIIVPALVLIMALFMRKKLLEKNPNNIVFINMAVYSFIIYFLSAVSIYIFNRIAYFPAIFSIMLVPEMVTLLKPNQEDIENYDKLKVKMKSANKNEQKRLIKELKDLKSAAVDSKIFHGFSLGFILIGGFIYFQMHYSYGSNNAYPYRSVSTSFNNINLLNLNNDRGMRSNDIYMANSLDNLLMELNDDDYLFILTTQISSPAMDDVPMDWQQKRFYDFGLETPLKNEVGKNYIAVVDGSKAVYEQCDIGELQKSLELEGLDIQIMVDNETSSIKIDGTEHSTGKYKANVVVYDKVLKRVIDSVNINPPFKPIFTKTLNHYYTRKQNDQ